MTQKVKSKNSTYQNPELIGNSEGLDINKVNFFMIKIELLHSMQIRRKIQKLGGAQMFFISDLLLEKFELMLTERSVRLTFRPKNTLLSIPLALYCNG